MHSVPSQKIIPLSTPALPVAYPDPYEGREHDGCGNVGQFANAIQRDAVHGLQADRIPKTPVRLAETNPEATAFT